MKKIIHSLKKNTARKKSRILDRKKVNPNAFVFTGTETEEVFDIQLFKYNKDECIDTYNIQINDIEDFKDSNFQYWLNIHGLSNTQVITEICSKLKIHNLVIQDILDVNQRPKFLEFDEYCFFTIKSIIPFDAEMLSEQISFVFGKNYLVSFQERKADYFEHLRVRLKEHSGILRERTSDYLLFTLLESILDNYFKTLQSIESSVEECGIIDMSSEPSPAILEKIENNKRHIQIIRKAVVPIKDFSKFIERDESQFIEKRHYKYFLEVKDLCLTLLDTCDVLEASLESSINLFFSVQGHRMNQVMKTLTIVATIFIPLTFIAGIYGMNFSHMPELQWEYGYLAVWILIVVIFLLMVLYLKRLKWF